MKLEMKREYSATHDDYVYNIYKDGFYVTGRIDSCKADEFFEKYKKELKEKPEIIRSEEIE